MRTLLQSPDVRPVAPRRPWALRRRRRRYESGVALILVLGSLTIMAVMLTEFQDESSAEFGSALSYRDSLKAEYAARSGIALSRLLISAEPTIRKDVAPLLQLALGAPTQIPVWEYAEDVLGAFNDEAGGKRFSALTGVGLGDGKSLGLEGAGFELQVVDEDSKINLNKAAKGDILSIQRLAIEMLGLIGGPQYSPLFDQRDADGQFSTRQAVCGAIVDWVDPDQDAYGCDPHSEQLQVEGPEDSFYQLLDDPYPRKNAAFDSLEELRMVRGIGDDFWATFVQPEPYDHKSRVLSVWGQGAMNVNTANAQSIHAYVCGAAVEDTAICVDPLKAATFISTIGLLRGFVPGIPLFGNPQVFINSMKGGGMLGPLLQGMDIPPVVFRSDSEAQKGISTTSKVFSIVATGFVKAFKRQTRVRIHAVVDFRKAPAPWDIKAAYDQQQATGLIAPDRVLSPGALTTDEDDEPNRIGAVLQANPDGRVIHYRVN